MFMWALLCPRRYIYRESMSTAPGLPGHGIQHGLELEECLSALPMLFCTEIGDYGKSSLSYSFLPFLTCRCRWYEIFKHWKYPKMSRINMALWILMTLWQVQFSLVAQLCLTLCNPMDCSMPGLPCNHQLLEFTQTHVHWVGDAIQSSHPLSSPSLPPFNLSQHQGLFQWVSSLN